MTFSVCHLNTARETNKGYQSAAQLFLQKTTSISINGVPINQLPTLCLCVSVFWWNKLIIITTLTQTIQKNLGGPSRSEQVNLVENELLTALVLSVMLPK